MDSKIQLNLKSKTEFPNLKDNQVALTLAEMTSGQLLNTDKNMYLGEDHLYHIFDSLEDAKEFAKTTIVNNPKLESWIMTHKDTAIFYLNKNEEKNFSQKKKAGNNM